ncbi:MAG: efflux RND transporter periplasmic adaptor subunit [Bacteroidaceae bacterium]|nr:efflux RND transporter periplasmic adaptor subunit [Bacteroidaceae bacterium]MBQ9191117.1 efflux RND transporter periplasmic adaptor subunit [Bacteroidaceae bacterium]MBR0243546.1 efflux RND transporter periplasmic adaptor subunit [Bacteroidaceae bacterium]MBR1666012.1 efflux RND transporter periplasmic adaptor subunit [Bacteroidaceae bacterium]MBR1790789.1 efflux RND transporter periplasmic adaptor subunit [Bacteroidaceae bacterium]
MKKFFRLFLFALVALVFIGTFVFLYLNSRPKPVVYETLTPSVLDLSKTTVVTGKIEPRDEVAVKPQISGIITELLKEAGQHVEAGEVIAKLKVIPDMNQLASAESRVRLSRLNLEQAKTDHERQKTLYDKGLISANEYEKVRQTYNQAREEANIAQEQLELTRDGVSASNASSSNTLVRSTISGIILDIPVKVGNSVILSNTFNDGTTIASVADMSNLIFRGNIDETEVGRLTVGMPMQITIGALQDLRFSASLEYISPKATATTGGANQFEIKAAVSVPADSLASSASLIRSGYSATAQIVLEKADKVLTIPEAAVEFSGDSTFVYVIKQDKAKEQTYERRQVTTGLSDGINIEIRSGLKADELVRGNVIVADNKE